MRGTTTGEYKIVNDSGTISIHVPREGDDAVGFAKGLPNAIFQSTSPVRGTTSLVPTLQALIRNFNPRPP